MIFCRNYMLIFMFALLPNFIQSKPVEKDKALLVAKNFFQDRITGHMPVVVLNEYTEYSSGKVLLYIFNIDQGFIIVAGDDISYPIICYSFESGYSSANQHESFRQWLNACKTIILMGINHPQSVPDKTRKMWDYYSSDEFVFRGIRNEVNPLILSKWSQGAPYNVFFPADTNFQSGHAYTGCVATAMGQVLKYYNWPKTGDGSLTYFSPMYGQLSADFGETNYNWAEMQYHPQESDSATALLLYHCAISIESQFTPAGTGGYDFDARDAMVNYFDFSQDAQFLLRDTYFGDWTGLLKDELDSGRPVIYGCADQNANTGHTLICDGYQDDFFHFNWGWNGQYNGYFYLDSLIVGNYHFDFQHDAVIGIYPDIEGNPELFPPLNLNALVTGQNVNLSWDPPAQTSSLELIGYNIYRNEILISEMIIGDLSFEDIAPPAGSNLYKVVGAFIGRNNGPFVSKEVYISGLDEIAYLLISVYPNPVEDYLFVECSNYSGKKIMLRLNSVDGKPVYAELLSIVSGESSVIDVSFLNPGIYLLSVHADGIDHCEKILIR